MTREVVTQVVSTAVVLLALLLVWRSIMTKLEDVQAEFQGFVDDAMAKFEELGTAEEAIDAAVAEALASDVVTDEARDSVAFEAFIEKIKEARAMLPKKPVPPIDPSANG